MEEEPPGLDLEDQKCQVQQKVLEEGLGQEGVRVHSLTSMVEAADESSGDHATAALEERLKVHLAGGQRVAGFLSNASF